MVVDRLQEFVREDLESVGAALGVHATVPFVSRNQQIQNTALVGVLHEFIIVFEPNEIRPEILTLLCRSLAPQEEVLLLLYHLKQLSRSHQIRRAVSVLGNEQLDLVGLWQGVAADYFNLLLQTVAMLHQKDV